MLWGFAVSDGKHGKLLADTERCGNREKQKRKKKIKNRDQERAGGREKMPDRMMGRSDGQQVFRNLMNPFQRPTTRA